MKSLNLNIKIFLLQFLLTLEDKVDDHFKRLLDKASIDFEPDCTSTIESSSSTSSVECAIPHYHTQQTQAGSSYFFRRLVGLARVLVNLFC